MIRFFVILIAIGAAWVVGTFNSLAKKRNAIEIIRFRISRHLEYRFDLVSSLIKIVEDTVNYELSALEDVVSARLGIINSQSHNLVERGKAEEILYREVRDFFIVAENYPRLRDLQNFQDIRKKFIDSENELQNHKRAYNASVSEYNKMIRSFPVYIITGLLGFEKYDFFGNEEGSAS